MYLKSIEIQGFKSFAHKTVLNFNEGMTAIVGPNGSGKSNIADAVRWVLGEQKVKQLRGSSMQDVIFAGTELRKPLGFACVSMLFDNTDRRLALDYSEVSVTRRLYRSGESEYLINGQNVRLKDVQELFFDTGIGKEGYSIIGQGQIEAIVSGRPEDRRGLFDEACGIVKFKKRKQAAEKKLEEEEINLNRVTDIKNELEKRIGPLEKQSAGAREYLRLRDLLKSCELSAFVQETDSILSDLEETEKNTAMVRDSIEAVHEESERLRSKNQELSDDIQKAEALISQGREDKMKGELLITNLESQISVAETEIGAENSNILLFQENIKKLQNSSEDRRKLMKDNFSSILQMKNDFQLLKEGNEGIFRDPSYLRLFSLTQKLDECGEQLKKLLPEEDQRGISARVSDQETPEAEDEFEFEEPAWLSAIKSKRNNLSEVSERTDKINSWLERSRAEQRRLQEELKSVQENRNGIIVKRNVTQSKLETLRNLAERYEGYGTAVVSVMQQKAREKGILGVTADLIRTEPKFETAIETALGNKIQNIVTDTEKTAKRLIEFLKEQKIGRATFLPMDALHGKTQEEYLAAKSEPGCLGLASDVAEADPGYEELVLTLLGNILVFDTVDHALSCAGKNRHGLRIVTLEGEYLSPGGSISGGAYRNNSNLMGRTRELKELENQVAELTAQIRSSGEKQKEAEEKILEKEKEIGSLSEQLEKALSERNELSFGLLSDLKVKIANLSQSMEFTLETVQRCIEEAQKELDEEKELNDRIQASERLIEKHREEISCRQADIIHVHKGMEESLKKAETAQLHKDGLLKSQSRYFEKKDQLNDDTLRLEKDLLRLENTKERLNSQLDAGTSHIWEEYGVTLSDARKFSPEKNRPLSELKETTLKLNTQIKALGMINIQAIEEFKEVSSRYEILKTQYEDVRAAREQIVGVIRELDTGMKEQFNEQFFCIRQEFQKVFKELFGGGKADLELVFEEETGETDELSAGISITAQPPGKKLQNMMQLSGGEKAFTAIALLFAIQNLKPSPFCLLDEIEAALDDSNVFRFASYIRKICDRSQFILITHRRGTMEAADRLYGITMQEKGVTSLVSVDLVEDSLK